MATKRSAMLMANEVIKWKVFLSKKSNVHSSTTRLQKIVEPKLTQRHSDVLMSVAHSKILNTSYMSTSADPDQTASEEAV